MARRSEDFPDWMYRALKLAQENGDQLARFETEEECSGERLRFYKLLAALKREPSDELHEAAKACVVRWLKAPGTNSKRLLRIVITKRTADPLMGDRAEIDMQLERQRLEQEMRAQFRGDGRKK